MPDRKLLKLRKTDGLPKAVSVRVGTASWITNGSRFQPLTHARYPAFLIRRIEDAAASYQASIIFLVALLWNSCEFLRFILIVPLSSGHSNDWVRGL